MIINKLTKSLLKFTEEDNTPDCIAIKSMIELDRLLKCRYIKSKSNDDVAYQLYLDTGEFDIIEAIMNQGEIREKISHLITNKLVYEVKKSWRDVSMQIIYAVDVIINIREAAEIKSNVELMEYFEFVDNSRKLLK